MEDAFDDTLEAHTPEGFSSGRDKCFSEEGGFSLQGADHPSPVSVLDSPIFQGGFHLEELSTSPDSVKSIMLRHEGTFSSICTPFFGHITSLYAMFIVGLNVFIPPARGLIDAVI